MSAEEPEEGMPPGDPSVTDPATATPDALAPSEIRHQPSVKEALESSAAAGTPEKEQRTLRGAWVYGLITVGLGILYVLLERRTLLPSL